MWSKTKFNEVLKKKEIQEGKENQLEKGDWPALLIAAFSVFLPIILLFMGVLALLIWLLLSYIH